MLTIKVINPNLTQDVMEAEQVRYEPGREVPDFANRPPPNWINAVVLAQGVPGSPINPRPIEAGTVFVMNDKGRTIATYHLDMENAAATLRPTG